MRTQNVGITIVALLTLGMGVFICINSGKNNQAALKQSNKPPAMAKSSVMQELTFPTDYPVTDWIFKAFSEEKTYSEGFVYSWGIFENANVAGKDSIKVTAMCSSPNSPDPKPGDEYYWDKKTNIFVPVKDYTNTQRFWYPRPYE